MALYLDGRKVLPICDSASDTTFDDTNVAYEADDVQEALEKVTKSLTYAEYEALTDAEKNNGTIYLITDINGTGDKFQPAIYSGQEREIGVWTNGKPIYQKTLTCTAATGIGPNDWATIPWDSEPSDIEFLVTGQIHQGDVPNSYATVRAEYTGGHVKLAALYSSTFGANAKLTIWYTKATDAAGSGTWTPQGVPAIHYSEEEQVVGTWINGKTLYARTFVNENLTKSAVSSYDVYTVGTFDINAEMAFFITGALYETNDQRYFTLPYERSYSSTQKVYQELYTDASGKLYILASSIRSSGFNFSKAYITAYYTKRS